MKKYEVKYARRGSDFGTIEDEMGNIITQHIWHTDAQLLCDTLNENERLKEENAALLRTQAEMLKEIMP